MSQVYETSEALTYELVWQSESNGLALVSTKWEVRGIGPNALGLATPEAVKTEDGFLKLYAKKKDGHILLGVVTTVMDTVMGWMIKSPL